jgi:hypothetical protein
MSAMPAQDRPDRRPEWMQRKHAGTSPADMDVREVFAGLVRRAHAAGKPLRVSDLTGTTYDDEEEARDDGRLLYDAGRRLGIAVSAWPTDPAAGKCKNCDGWPRDGATCQPSRRGISDLHFRAFDKTAARRYVVDTYGGDTEQWPYQPGSTRHPGDQGPQHAFGAGNIPPAEDEPPDRSGFRRTPKPPAASTGRTARASGSARGRQQQVPAQAEGEGALAKILRWASG